MKILPTLLFLLIATSAQAVTYFVGKGAGDLNSNSCTSAQTDTDGNRKATISGNSGGISCLSGGDTLTIRTGTYVERIDSSSDNIPSGTSTTSVTTIQGASGETVTLKPTGSAPTILIDTNLDFVTFDNLILDGADVSIAGKAGSLRIEKNVGASFITFQNGEIKNVPTSGINAGEGNSNISILNNRIHEIDGSQTGTTSGAHGIYWRSSNGLIEGNEIFEFNGWCIQFYIGAGTPDVRDNVFTRNICYNTTAANNLKGGIFLGGAAKSNKIHNNVIRDLKKGMNGGGSNNDIYNNTFYNLSDTIKVKTASNTVRSNIMISTGGTEDDATFSNNLTSGTDTDIFTDPVNDDYSLKLGSVAINAGTVITGYSFNGSAPDQGAFESWVFASGTVAANTMTVIFENNKNNPILPSSSLTTFTVNNGRSVTSATRVGDNSVDIVFSGSVCDNESWTFSYTAGNVTDSALLGNLAANVQPLHAIVNQPVTNNCAGGGGGDPTDTVTQTGAIFRLSHGTESGTPNTDAGEDNGTILADTIPPNGVKRLRLEIRCDNTADCPPFGPVLYVDIGGGGYNEVTNTCTSTTMCFYGTGDTKLETIDGTATTDQLNGTETFVACEVKRGSGGVPSVDLGQNQLTECEWVLQAGSGITNEVFSFRAGKDGGSSPDFDTYSVTPTLTARALRGMR